MLENFFHYPNDIIFHGTNEPAGYTFAEARDLATDRAKLQKLKERLTGYFINGLTSTPHSFITVIMTCVGLEVLGQVMLGFDQRGETISAHTIQVYEMLDVQLTQPLTEKFREQYNLNRNSQGQSRDYTQGFSSYAHVVRKGLRNAFTHTYRSLGVFLGGVDGHFMLVDDEQGWIVIDPNAFRDRFIELYEQCFEEAIIGSNETYKTNALSYFNLLIR
jgi:hypothetical protein